MKIKLALGFIGFIVSMCATKETTEREKFKATYELKNGNRTVTLGYDPAIEKFRLLRAVDFNNKDVFMQSPFIYSIDTSIVYNPNVTIDAYIVKNSSEASKFLDIDLKVEATMPWVDLQGEDNYNKSTNVKDNSYSLVLTFSSIYNPEVPDDNAIFLTQEARGLVSDPNAFVEKFGNYFCSAVYKGHYLRFEINLKNKFSTELENYFHKGKAKLPIDVLNVDFQSQLRLEAKSIATNNQGGISIKTIGGPDEKEYRGILISLFKGDANYSEITDAVGALIGKLRYSSAKNMKIELSDYYSWGIEQNALILDAIVETQMNIRRLSKSIRSEIDLISEVSTDPFLTTIYSKRQIEVAKSNITKLRDLYEEILECHYRLNEGDTEMIRKDSEFTSRFIEIKKSDPQVFDYLVARPVGVPAKAFYSGFHGPEEYNNFREIYNQTFIFNSLNSPNAFNFISNINITNELTGNVVNTIDFNNFSFSQIVTSDGVRSLNLLNLIGDTNLPNFADKLALDFTLGVNRFVNEGASILNRKIPYALNIKDKGGRTFTYSLIDISLSTSNAMILVNHMIPDNCCNVMLDYEQHAVGDFGRMDKPSDLKISLENIKLHYSDSLIIEITTDNTTINHTIGHDLDLHLGRRDFQELIQNPFLYLDIGDILDQIHTLNFKWYSKSKIGERDSDIYSMNFHVDRVLCLPTIRLSEDTEINTEPN